MTGGRRGSGGSERRAASSSLRRTLVPAALAALLAVLALGLLARHRPGLGQARAPTQRRALCHGPLTGRTLALPAGLAGFGRVQGQPALPLAAGEYVLTIDDGPDPVTTPALLAALDRACVPATFFLIGRHARAHPDLVQAIVAAGQGVGSHSDSHGNLAALSAEARRRDILAGVEAVERGAWDRARPDAAPRLFRIPGGAGTPLIPSAAWMRALAADHLVLTGYDLSAQDWRNDPAPVTMARFDSLLAHPATGDRGVIVLHDGQPNTVQLLPMILNRLQERGAKIVALRLAQGIQP